jgi:transcriptional regulator with XRE-family HTH domain
MTLGEAVARNVRKLRTQRGLSQEALAHGAQVHRTYIGMIERGECSPTIDTLERLAEALGVDPVRLLQRK